VDPLWAELINSDWHDHLGSGRREDRITNDEWLARFLGRIGWQGRRLPEPGERARLRSLRRLLRRAVDELRAGSALAAGDVAALNRLLAAYSSARRLKPVDGRLVLVERPALGGIDHLLGAVAASFAEMVATGDPRRIKVCANPDCLWVIYDESRNRSRRWCEAAVCGSLVKVRRFRQRRRR
jgi:predicted RNA-binding Zn ribbon-like protein